MKKIIWSPTANKSLERLINFIDNKWEKKIADDLLEVIEHTLKLISQNPEICPLYSKKEKYPQVRY